ncbi:MAG TPA: tripartite tricarboxylate transporter substrate-binding protein [Solirubrobacteraceae bacterium]|nr:tripartite tricarboxylate transporter substrate-binding protein [Solirubrobacteraceae bacterium]
MSQRPTFPSRGLTLVEPFGAGGGPDLIARALAARLSHVWRVPVSVDNRAGAGATAAPAFVAAAAPDGCTLLVNTSAHAYSAALVEGRTYDPRDDFVAVAPLSSQPYVLVASPSSGMRTLADLASAGRTRAGKLRFASSGIGTATHLGVEKLNADLGIAAMHTPAGPTEAGADTGARVAAGEADYAMSPISMAGPLVFTGELVALGVSGSRRSRLLPDVPTIAQAGAPGFDFPIWYGIWAPAGTPARIIDTLARDIATAVATPELRDEFLRHDAEPLTMTRADFAAFVIRESEMAARLLSSA